MRILHIFDHSIPLHSGYTFRSRAILDTQRSLGWETFHITSPKQGKVSAMEELVDGLLFYRTPAEPLRRRGGSFLNQWAVVAALERRLLEIIPKLKPDILHAHSPALNGWAALRAGRRLNIPVVYEIRAFWEDAAVDHGTAKEWGMRYRLTRALETHVAARAQAITTICQGLRDDLIARGLPPGKITVIPNAVDISKFQLGGAPNVPLVRQLGLEGKLVLGFIGSFYAYEGLDLLVEALPMLCQAVPDVRLLLVGGGPQEALLRKLVHSRSLDNMVHFIGRVPHDQVQTYYNLVDIFAYPRRSMRLTELVTPLKPLEAMAQGSLIVASDVGGHRELIRDGETGCLFRAGDARDLIDKIIQLRERRGLWPSMRAAARNFVERERNWADSVARYRAVYDKVLQ